MAKKHQTRPPARPVSHLPPPTSASPAGDHAQSPAPQVGGFINAAIKFAQQLGQMLINTAPRGGVKRIEIHDRQGAHVVNTLLTSVVIGPIESDFTLEGAPEVIQAIETANAASRTAVAESQAAAARAQAESRAAAAGHH